MSFFGLLITWILLYWSFERDSPIGPFGEIYMGIMFRISSAVMLENNDIFDLYYLV